MNARDKAVIIGIGGLGFLTGWLVWNGWCHILDRAYTGSWRHAH